MRCTPLWLAGCLVWSWIAGGCSAAPVAGECRENSRLGCLTRRVCSYDPKRDCMRCRCEQVDGIDPVREAERIHGQRPEDDGPGRP